jgi:hypothetical protein
VVDQEDKAENYSIERFQRLGERRQGRPWRFAFKDGAANAASMEREPRVP